MAEYIEKVAFNYAIREAVRKYPNSFYNGLEVARQIAHDFPAADVLEVVHCADCVHAEESLVSGCVYCNEMERARIKEGFCAWGERKANNG